MKLIDGKAVSAEVKEQLAEEVKRFVASGLRAPALAVILVGDDPASAVYVRNKKRACEQIGITSLEFILPAETEEDSLLALIDRLNSDDGVDGILVQMPLPPHIDAKKVIEAISPDKDVDAFHPYNVGLLNMGTPRFLPCTPAGVMRLLSHYGISVAGKDCVVVGRSNTCDSRYLPHSLKKTTGGIDHILPELHFVSYLIFVRNVFHLFNSSCC